MYIIVFLLKCALYVSLFFGLSIPAVTAIIIQLIVVGLPVSLVAVATLTNVRIVCADLIHVHAWAEAHTMCILDRQLPITGQVHARVVLVALVVVLRLLHVLHLLWAVAVHHAVAHGHWVVGIVDLSAARFHTNLLIVVVGVHTVVMAVGWNNWLAKNAILLGSAGIVIVRSVLISQEVQENHLSKINAENSLCKVPDAEQD